MLAILLGSVGIAYWLVLARTVMPRQRGAEIIRTIRQKKLSAYWGEQAEELKYDIRNKAGQRVGMFYASRGPAETGFKGSTTLRRPAGTIASQWWLTVDASTGRYFSASTLTSISLSDGKVSVEQPSGRKLLKAESDAPANYIPEGLTHLIIRMVAERGERATFKIILDNEAIVNSRLRFVGVTMVPLSSRKVQVYFASIRGAGTQVYYLDEHGKVVKIDWPNEGVSYVLRPMARKKKPLPAPRTLFQPKMPLAMKERPM